MGTKKNITIYDAINFLAWIDYENGFWATTKLPIKMQWNMKKNITSLQKIRGDYDEFYKKIQEKYSTDEYSEDKEQDGKTVRIVKDEFIADFNREMNELLAIENEVEIIQFGIEDFGEINIQKADMDMLSFFIKDEEETQKLEKVEGEVVE